MSTSENIRQNHQAKEAFELGQKDVFCEIIDHKEPAIRVFETAFASVIIDMAGGYPLVLARDHSEKNISEVLKLAGQMQASVKKAYEADGIKIVMNLGKAAGQEIEHPHVHIIPREQLGENGKNIVVKDFGERNRLARKVRTLCEDLIPYQYKRKSII